MSPISYFRFVDSCCSSFQFLAFKYSRGSLYFFLFIMSLHPACCVRCISGILHRLLLFSIFIYGIFELAGRICLRLLSLSFFLFFVSFLLANVGIINKEVIMPLITAFSLLIGELVHTLVLITLSFFSRCSSSPDYATG